MAVSLDTPTLMRRVILNKSDDGKHVDRFLEYAEAVKNPPKLEVLAGPALEINKSTAIEQKDFL